MKRPILALLGACALLTDAAAAEAPAARVGATLTLRDASALEVSYRLPPSCPALTFRNEDMRAQNAAEMRSDWRAADDCTVLEGDRIRRNDPSCTTLRLRVPATTRNLDRTYPWAYPVEKGLYAHTSAYAVTDACGAVDWTIEAPGGTVVVDGVASAERGMRAAGSGADAIPAVLIAQAFQPGALGRVHADARFAPQTLRFLDASVDSLARQLARDLPGVPFKVPFIVATPSAPYSFWGDVANRTVMRLAFPPAPGPEQEAMLHTFVAHEMAHLTQPSDWHDAWQEDGATIGEGGAEFLRVVTGFQLGWLDRAALKDELEKAVNGCLLAAAGKSWKAMRNRGFGKNPYECGLTFYAIALSAPAGATPLLRLRDYNRQGKLGAATDFAQALECGGAAACKPYWLARLAGDEPLEAVLADYARRPGALLQAATAWSPALAETLAYRHMAELMRADCKGAVSMYHEKGAARIASGPSCGVLKPDMVVVSAEGLPLFGGEAGLKASLHACESAGRTVLGLKDGTSVTLACGKELMPPRQLYAVDIERAQALAR